MKIQIIKRMMSEKNITLPCKAKLENSGNRN